MLPFVYILRSRYFFLWFRRHNEDDIDLLFHLLRVYNTRQVISLHFLSRFLEDSVIKVCSVSHAVCVMTGVVCYRAPLFCIREKFSLSLSKCFWTFITCKNLKQKYYNTLYCQCLHTPLKTEELMKWVSCTYIIPYRENFGKWQPQLHLVKKTFSLALSFFQVLWVIVGLTFGKFVGNLLLKFSAFHYHNTISFV